MPEFGTRKPNRLNERFLKKKTPQDWRGGPLILKRARLQLQQEGKKVDESIPSFEQALRYAPEDAIGALHSAPHSSRRAALSRLKRVARSGTIAFNFFFEAWKGNSAVQCFGNRRLERGSRPIADQLKKIRAGRSAAEAICDHATA